MPTIRALRRSRGMTFSELALTSGVPIRTLAEIEYGLQTLDSQTRQALARVFNLAPELLRGQPMPAPQPRRDPQQQVAVGLMTAVSVAALVPMLRGGGPLIDAARTLSTMMQPARGPAQAAFAAASQTSEPTAEATATSGPTATAERSPTAEPTATTESSPTASPTSSPTVEPTATALPPTPTPAFTLAADGPHGCPLSPIAGTQIVITQGYGVGTHAPAATWGAVDLAIDTNGDGNGEPETTFGRQIVATHGGIARIYPNSWPGGNFVIITNAESGYATAYGHLGSFSITDGQTVTAGTPIGTVGSTGMASGPHLHYEVRTSHGNIDPAPLIGCDT